MHCVFLDHRGILLDYAVPRGTTVYGNGYLDILQKLRRAVCDKCLGLLKQGVILHDDNAAGCSPNHGNGTGKFLEHPSLLAGYSSM